MNQETLSVQIIVSTLCLVLGGAISKAPIQRWLIPICVALLGGVIYCGYTADWSSQAFILGIYSGVASTGLYEVTKKRDGGQKTEVRSHKPDIRLAVDSTEARAVFEKLATATRNAGGTPAAPSADLERAIRLGEVDAGHPIVDPPINPPSTAKKGGRETAQPTTPTKESNEHVSPQT